MFRSRKTRRRRSGSSASKGRSTKFCRLGVEVMEGRLMLSGSSYDYSVVGSDTNEFTVAPIKIFLTGDQVTTSFQVHLDLDNNLGNAFQWVKDTWNADNAQGLPTSVIRSNIVISAGDVYSSSPNNSFDSFQDDTSLFGSSGPPVAVIPPTIDAGTLQPTIKPIVAGPSPGSGPIDGGSIPIHAIFADLRNDTRLESDSKSVSTKATEKSLESLASARQTSIPETSLSGEWARAMVFEIAGGEPGSTDASSLDGKNTTTSGSEESLQRAVPLSAVEAAQQKVKSNGPNAVTSPANAAPADQQSVSTSGKVVAFRIPRGQLNQLGALAANHLLPNGDAAGENTDTTTAVFDQLGNEQVAAIDSTLSTKSWLHSVGAVPLLMALAVERIAAINSRRGRKEDRKAPAKRLFQPTLRRLESK